MITSLTIVVPVYAGANYLDALVSRITEIRQEWIDKNYPFMVSELIFVDDSSSDGSFEILSKLSKVDWINVISLAQNFGQHAATAAGISYSSGDWVVTMDEDMQHDPAILTEMLRKAVTSQSDIVYAHPKSFVHKSFYRDRASRGCKKLISWLARNPNVRQFNSYRLIRGPIARAAAAVFSHDGYYDIILTWHTNRVSSLETQMIDQRYAETGKSGYNFRKLLTHARKLIMTSDAKILRLAGMYGVFMLFLCVLLGGYFLIAKIYFPGSVPVDGWTSLMVSVLSVGGGGMLILSVIAEYVASLSKHVHGKPSYVVVDRSRDEVLRDFFSE
jgi:glycosyltransferase involved in cell wall biosynthesis